MPIISEAEATRLLTGYGTSTPEEQAINKPLLIQYREHHKEQGTDAFPTQTQARRSEKERFYSTVENPALLADDNGIFSATPDNPALTDELRHTEVNAQFLSRRYGKPVDEIKQNQELYALDYGSTKWNEGAPLDPARFYARVKDEVGKEKQQGAFQDELLEAAYSASMTGEAKGWNQWVESARSNPAYKAEHEGRYFEAWNAVKNRVDEDLGDSAWAIRSTIKKMRQDKGLPGDLNQAAAAWEHPERQLVDLLTDNPAGYRQAKRMIQKMASIGTPEEKAGVFGWFQKMGESLNRGGVDAVDGIYEGAQTLGAENIANAIGEERIAKRVAAEVRVQSDMKDIANGIVDPVERKNWFDTMAFGLADSAPAMLLGQGTGARKYIGRAALALGYGAEAKHNFADNGWTGPGADTAASFVGVMSAAVESISEGFQLRKAWRMTTQSMIKNYGAEIAFRMGSEIFEEGVQDNMAALTQTVTSAIGLSPERDKGLLDEVKDWMGHSLYDVALVSLPLAALGAKTGASDRISRAKVAEMTADKVELSRLFGADAAATLSAISDPDERLRAVQATYSEQSAADRVRHLTLINEVQRYQDNYEKTMADTATSAISMTLNRDGWQVTQRNGETITVDSADAARRVREELRQVQTVEEAAGLVSAMDSWVRKGSETNQRSATLSGERVQSDGTAIIHSRDGKVTKSITDGKALTELRAEAELVAGKNGNEDVFVLVNGSNSVFVDRVGGMVKGVVKRLDLNQSGVPQVMTFLHESLESSFNEGLLTGTLTPDMVTRAAKALFPVMDPAKARDADEKRLIESLERVAAGTGSETEMRETLIELAVRDVLERDVRGRRTGYKAGTFAKALDAAMMTATSKEELTAFGKIAEFFRAISTMLKGVFGTVQALSEAKEAGTLAEGNDFETFVDQMLGLDEQNDFDDELVQTVEGLAPDMSSIETYSIKVQTIAANMLADAAGVPSTLDKFYVGMKFIPMEADKTAGGGFFGEIAQIPAQGGPAFPLLPEYRDKDVVWASSSPGYWRGKLNQAKEGGIIFTGKDGKQKFLVAPYAMKDDSHTSNATIIAAKFSELERYVAEGRLSAKQETAIADMLNDAATKAKVTAEAKRDAQKAILAEEGALDLLKKIKIDASQEMEDDDTEEKPKVKKKKKGEDASQDRIDAAIKEYKKHAIVIAQMEGILKFPKTFTAAQINAFRNELNFPQRKWIADKLSSAAAEKLGVPPMDQVRRATLDASTPGVSEMSLFSLLEVDVERLELGLKDGTLKGSDFGVPSHGSYDTFAPGKAVVHFRTPVPYSLAMPTLKAELESQDRTNHPYYLKGRMPKGLEREQKISPDMLKQWNEAQIEVMPNQAKAIIAALNDKWIEISRAGQAGVADFVRAIRNSDAAITLSKYDEKEVSALLKSGDMKIFRLPIRMVKKAKKVDGVSESVMVPEGEIYFALKRPDGKDDPGDPKKDWTIVSVMNNEGGAAGIMPLLLAKAVKSGGNHLDCFAVKSEKFPNGLLPTLYSRAGFKTFQDAPFAPEYYTGPGEMGELTKVWESQGWAGQERPGMVWMKHDGIPSITNSDSVATESIDAERADRSGMERGSTEGAGSEASQTAASLGGSGQESVRGGLPDGASARRDAGHGGGILPRSDGGSARSVVGKVVERLRGANDSQLAALGVSREEVDSAVEQYDNSTRDGITSYSVSKKAARRNSLRVLLTRTALTNAAMTQESWRDWYEEHQETLNEFFGEDAELFQKILAITSQAASVKANVGLALKAYAELKQGINFDARSRGKEKPGYLPAVIGNLTALRDETKVNGQKIGAYMAANEGDTESVVVDRHIARMLFGVDTPSKAQFAKATKILTSIAKDLGWTPRQVQAALWAASIVKSGKTPESYGNRIRTLHAKGTLRKRIGAVAPSSSAVHRDAGSRGADNGGSSESASRGGVVSHSVSKAQSYEEVTERYKGTQNLVRSSEGRVHSSIVRDLLKRRQDGENISPEVLDRAVKEHFPSYRVKVPKSMSDISSEEEVLNAMKTQTEGGGDQYKKHIESMKGGLPTEGESTTVRQDVPSVKKGVGTVTTRVGDKVFYRPATRLKDAKFNTNEKATLKIGLGELPKGPHIKIEGKWMDDQSMPTDLENWTQVGFNPDRHSFYYERGTERQVVSADEIYQVGNTVFAKGAVFEDVRTNISYSVSSGSRLEQVQAELDRRLSTDPARRRQLAQEALMKLENLRERWETERWTAKGDLIRPITEKRTTANLDREGAMRQAMAVQRILSGMGIDPGYATLSKDAKDYEAWQRYQESKALLIEGGMTEAEAERLAAASASTWRSKAVSNVRSALTQAKAEVQAWRDEQDAMQKKDWSPKASLLRDLRTLDAMLSVLPVEVRAKVGGFIKLASYSTETSRLEELNRRVAMIETELEKHLQKEIRGEIKEMFEKATPTLEGGEKPKGAMTEESHRLTFLALAASKVPAVEVNGERQKLDDLLLEVDANVVSIAERMQILEMFGGMDEMNAASLDSALGWLTEVVSNGRSLWKAKEELRLLEQKMKADEARMATGREGSIDQLQNNLRDEKTLKQESSGWGYELVSFEQVMGMLFDPNASVVKGIVEGIRRATYQRTDAIRQKRKEWQNAMSAIFAGKKWMDIQADLWDYAQTDSKSAMTVSWMKDRREKKIDVPLDIATRVVADPVNAKALGFDDIEVLTIQRMLDDNNALPAKNQKSTFEISRVFPGTPTGVPLSQNQAMNLTMLARQKDYQKALEHHGWTEDVIKEIESKLTREAKEMRAFLAEEYRAGYYSLNSVFQSMFGAPLPQILNYSPGTWEGMTADSTVSATGSEASAGGLSAGMFKNRRKHKAAPRLADAMVTYWQHVGTSEHFKAFAAPVRELKGVLLNPQLRASIEERGGKAGIAAITDWIKVFENDGVKRSVALGKLQEFQSRLQNAIATGVLAWNLGTLAKQSLATLGAAYEMPSSEYLLRFSRAVRGKLDIGAIFQSEMIRRRVEQGASPELRQVMEGMMGQHPGSNWVTQNGRKFAAAGMDLLGSTDGYFTSVSAAIYYDWQLDQAKKAGMNDADAAAVAMKATEGMVDRTAQPVETMQKSLFEAKAASNPQSRWVFMFASEARQKTALYGIAMSRLMKGKATRQDKQVVFISHVVAPMMLQFISSMITDWRDDDDKELLDAEHWSPALYIRSMLLGPFMGLPLLSGPVNSIISSLTGTTKFNNDATNPIGSAFSGFMSGVTKLNSDRKQKDDPAEIGVNMTKSALNIVSMASQLSPLGAGNAWMGTAGAVVDQAFDYFSNATGVDK